MNKELGKKSTSQVITPEETIELLREEMKFDLNSGEFKFGEWEKKPTPYNSEHEAWLAVLELQRYRHDNHLIYCVFEVRKVDTLVQFGHGKPDVHVKPYWYIYEKRSNQTC